MARVKICGNTDVTQVEMCVAAGVDCVGFVVEYPVPVPWNLTRAEAADLIAEVPPFVGRAVVTGGSAEIVLAITDALNPHLVQLHTDNSVDETAVIARELADRGIGLIRALRIRVATGEASGEITNPIEAALRLQGTGICALLLDAQSEQMPAGTGMTLNWEVARAVRESVSIPMILAGGLNPCNVNEAIREVEPYGVDVITGVEASRRVKDPDKVRGFVAHAKGLVV